MLNRREFLQAASLSALAAGWLAGCSTPTTGPAATPVVLDDAQRAILDVLGEALAPGAAAAGFSAYLEAQLAAPPEEALLMLRYLGVPPPYSAFYLPALAAVDRWSQSTHGVPASALRAEQAAAVVAELGANKPGEWGAPPAAFFYFVLRADAVDVAYGTRAGFERLGIPYMAHIEPARDW